MGDAGFRDWASKNKENVKNCPKCRARIEKDGGCNHMTCQTCNHEWCWICNGRYYSGHYDWWNPFGCTASHFSDNPKILLILLVNLLGFATFPIVLIGGPILCAFALSIELFFSKRICCHSNLCNLVWFFITLPVILGLGAAVSSLAAVLFLVPGYCYLLYRILFILFKMCCCCCLCVD